MYITPEERIEAVKAFALKHYAKGGWDIVVESMSDEDIQRAYGLARTTQGAIRNVAAYVGAADSYREDIIASGDDRKALEVDIKDFDEPIEWAVEDKPVDTTPAKRAPAPRAKKARKSKVA